MKTYKCHKIVQAAEIVGLKWIGLPEGSTSSGRADYLRLDDGTVKDAPKGTNAIPKVGDFYVVYDSAYASLSPRQQFLAGYAEVAPENGDAATVADPTGILGTVNYKGLSSHEFFAAVGDSAHKWAAAFRQIVLDSKVPIDDGLLIGWFANAIESAHSLRMLRAERAEASGLKASESTLELQVGSTALRAYDPEDRDADHRRACLIEARKLNPGNHIATHILRDAELFAAFVLKTPVPPKPYVQITHDAPLTVGTIASLCHAANRAACAAFGDDSQVAWEDAPEWQRESAIKSVIFTVQNPDAGPSAGHESWLEEKRATGWKYGTVKDVEAREHPCFVPYDELPSEQKLKDYLLQAIVRSCIRIGGDGALALAAA